MAKVSRAKVMNNVRDLIQKAITASSLEEQLKFVVMIGVGLEREKRLSPEMKARLSSLNSDIRRYILSDSGLAPDQAIKQLLWALNQTNPKFAQLALDLEDLVPK